MHRTTFVDTRSAASFAEEWLEAWNAHDRVLVGVASIAVSYCDVADLPAVEVMRGGHGRLAREVSCHYPALTNERRDDDRG